MRRGLSSVYGFIVIYLLTIAALEASSSTVGSLVSLQASHERADQLDSMQKIEHLTLRLSNGTLAVTNDGLIPSTLKYIHLTLPSSSSDLSINLKLSVGQTLQLNTRAASAISAITSLGNVFWTSPPAPALAGGGYAVTFDATGILAGTTQTLTVDGTSYLFNQLPLTFAWSAGEVHAFAYASGVAIGSGSRVGWTGTRGLAASQEGQLTVTQSGQVIADYLTQYYLTIISGGNIVTTPASPTADGWFNSGTAVYVTTDRVWNLVSNQSRTNLVSWGEDGATPTPVSRGASGTFTTGAVVMNSPHTLTLDSATQYFLWLQTGLPAPGTVPPLAVGYRYTSESTVSQILANPGFETGNLSPWATACGYSTVTVSSATVHSGSYSAFTSYLGDGGSCQLSQGFVAPPGATIVSVSASTYVYFGGVGIAWLSESCGSYWGTEASVANGWQQVSRSDSCPSGSTGVTLSLGVQGYCVAKCYSGTAYWDDASLSYTYSMQYGGATSTSLNTYDSNGELVTYRYLASYSFPGGASDRQLQVALPPSEMLTRILIGSGPSALSPSQYVLSGSTITIPEATLASYGSTYTLESSSSGGYSVSQWGSATGDDWYDSGTSATVAATATSPFLFDSWSGSPTISSPGSMQTTVVMSSYYAIVGRFLIGP